MRLTVYCRLSIDSEQVVLCSRSSIARWWHVALGILRKFLNTQSLMQLITRYHPNTKSPRLVTTTATPHPQQYFYSLHTLYQLNCNHTNTRYTQRLNDDILSHKFYCHLCGNHCIIVIDDNKCTAIYFTQTLSQ